MIQNSARLSKASHVKTNLYLLSVVPVPSLIYFALMFIYEVTRRVPWVDLGIFVTSFIALKARKSSAEGVRFLGGVWGHASSGNFEI